MATIQTFENNIVIDLPNDPKSGLKRKAIYETMIDNKKVKRLSIAWRVYSVDDNGNPINSPLIKDYGIELKAENTTIVDAAAEGAYVLNPDDPQYENSETLFGEYDFFTRVATYQPLVVYTMIQNKGLQAAAAGRFDI